MVESIKIEDLVGKTIGEIFTTLESRQGGLSQEEASRRLETYGSNELFAKEKVNLFRLFFSKFANPILITLLVAAGLSAMSGSTISASVIVAMVFLSVIVDFVNSYRSSRAVEELQKSVRLTTAVLRENQEKEIPVRQIVPGDLIVLSAGDIVPADCILVDGRDVFVNESVLTGESMPSEKQICQVLWMGSSVVSGSGKAVAVKTGRTTRMGGIAGILKSAEGPTEFDRELASFSYFIFKVTLVLVLLILLVGLFAERRQPLEVFLFAVAIAVGIAPELLPMIVTANLARGAIRMSQGGVIVKKLSAIHDLGSMDVLATDKTGTLTEDRMELMQCVNPNGKEDKRVLAAGYVSAFFQTSVRGSMDKAIQRKIKLDVKNCKKIDEIPFDYERRRDSVIVEISASGNRNKSFEGLPDGRILISKGAPEAVLSVCNREIGKSAALRLSDRGKINGLYQKLSGQGFRILAVAIKEVEIKARYELTEEKGMTLLGFLAFWDPPKKSAKASLRRIEEHGVAIKVITGDNRLVAEKIASELDLPVSGVVTSDELAKMSPAQISQAVEKANLFTRVTPEQKDQIIHVLRDNGHVVGYLGDGVNDVLALKSADVGISVNNAVDVAKETADIILLQKGLDEILVGVVEGRKTFANIFKYLMMALSSNFGNMASMPIGSTFLPFLPMTAPQILLNNSLYDASQLSIPFDHVDQEFIRKPKKFNMKFVRMFMLIFGPLSSIFDVITFLVMYLWFHASGASFQTAWFMESSATQILIVSSIRTRQFILKSKPSKTLFFASLGAVASAWIIPFTPMAAWFGFSSVPVSVLGILAVIVVAYVAVVESAKSIFYKSYGHLIEHEDKDYVRLSRNNS